MFDAKVSQCVLRVCSHIGSASSSQFQQNGFLGLSQWFFKHKDKSTTLQMCSYLARVRHPNQNVHLGIRGLTLNYIVQISAVINLSNLCQIVFYVCWVGQREDYLGLTRFTIPDWGMLRETMSNLASHDTMADTISTFYLIRLPTLSESKKVYS